jgi:hypothetical protein
MHNEIQGLLNAASRWTSSPGQATLKLRSPSAAPRTGRRETQNVCQQPALAASLTGGHHQQPSTCSNWGKLAAPLLALSNWRDLRRGYQIGKLIVAFKTDFIPFLDCARLPIPTPKINVNVTILYTIVIVASSLHALAVDVKVLSGAAHRSVHCPRCSDWATDTTSGKLRHGGAIARCRPAP